MIVDKMLKLCLLILVSTVAYVYAAEAIYPYEPKPTEFAGQEGCYNKDLNMVLPYNEPYYPKENGKCLKYTCGTNNETQLDSCGVLDYPDNCHLEYDYTLDYPKCCGTPVCDPTTPAPTEEPSTETCVTVTEPPCECPRPVRRSPKIPGGKKYRLPVEDPDC